MIGFKPNKEVIRGEFAKAIREAAMTGHHRLEPDTTEYSRSEDIDADIKYRFVWR